MAEDFFGGIGSAIGSVTNAIGSVAQGIGSGISDMLGGNVGTNPNMLMSQFRSQGIPAGAQPNRYYSPVQAQFSSGAAGKDWRVKISSPIIYDKDQDIFAPLAKTGGLIFPYLPTITMSHSADYQKIDTAHTNYPFHAYKNSQIDDITISGQFTVQDEQEGHYWLAMNHFLRTVTKMYFGQGDNIGNPPPICTLNGYGDFVYNNVSCVVKSFSVTLEKDVDYLSVSLGNTPGTSSGSNISYVPAISSVNVTLLPIYSREKIKSFNLTNFAKGQLVTNVDGKGFI